MKKYVKASVKTKGDIKREVAEVLISNILENVPIDPSTMAKLVPGYDKNWCGDISPDVVWDGYRNTIQHLSNLLADDYLEKCKDNILSAKDIDDDFGPGEHYPTPIEKVKTGDFFKLSDKPNGKVYVKDEYDRSEKAYWCYEYYDVNSGRYFKKGKTVYTGFTF